MCPGWAITMHQWASCKGAGTQSAALASWEVLGWPLSPLRTAAWCRGQCAGAAESSGHCVSAVHWPLGSSAVSPHPSVTHWLRECEREDRGLTVYHRCRRGWCHLPVLQEIPGGTGALEFLGKLKSVQSCPQLSRPGQGWSEACWAISEQAFDSCCMRNLPFSPAWAGLPSLLWCVTCDISLLSHFLSWGFWTLQV